MAITEEYEGLKVSYCRGKFIFVYFFMQRCVKEKHLLLFLFDEIIHKNLISISNTCVYI